MRHCGVFCWPQLRQPRRIFLPFAVTMLSVAWGPLGGVTLASPFLFRLDDREAGTDSSSSEESAAADLTRAGVVTRLDDFTSPHTTAGELTASPESAVCASNPSKCPPQPPRSDSAVGVRSPLCVIASKAASGSTPTSSPTVAAASSISFAWMVSAVAVAVFCVAMDRASLARSLAVAARERARRTASSSRSSIGGGGVGAIAATAPALSSPNGIIAEASSVSNPTPRSTVVRSLGSEGRFWSAVHSSFSLGLVSLRSASKVRAERVRSGPCEAKIG
mmetsp:Transcript_7248/g.19927  ORF Transcript_7248/g.19927 Transcript_7248/m.19927 type:complete len:277 (+) Transcript_7248:227-1057(+)